MATTTPEPFGLALFPPFDLDGDAEAGPLFERDLLAYLKTFGVNVHVGRFPQRSSLPAIVLFQIGAGHLHQVSGASGVATGRYQLTVFSTNPLDCVAIAEQLRLNLDRIRYRMGPTYVYAGILGNQLSRYDEPSSASDKGTHSKISEYTFHYRESVPA